MARLTAKRKQEIKDFVARWQTYLDKLEESNPRIWSKNMPLRASLNIIKELLGE